MSRPISHGVSRRPAAAPPRMILLWVVVVVLVAMGMYAIAPWILPARVTEGPMVQLAEPRAVTLVWFTSRPTTCRLVVNVDGADREAQEATTSGRRHQTRVSGLEPGRRYPYRILEGRRVLVEDVAFQTNRPLGEPFDFFVFGDSGRGSRVQYDLAARMTARQPPADFLVHTGDVVYPDGDRDDYNAKFFAPYRGLLSRIAIYPSVGNHDLSDGDDAAPYRAVFSLPKNGPADLLPDRNYWFDYGMARFAIIDSNLPEPVLRDKVAPWLREVLADPAPRWKFVVCHHPAYTAGKYHDSDDVALMRRVLAPVYEKSGVDIVFNGHDHNYQRTHPIRDGVVVEPGEGVIHVITGAGGAGLYDPAGPRPDFLAVMNHEHHSFTHVHIDGDTLALRQIARDGRVLDDGLVLRKPPAATQPTTQPGG